MRATAERTARQPHRDRGDPRQIPTEMEDRKNERRRIAETASCADAGGQPLERKARDERCRDESERSPRKTGHRRRARK